MPPPGWLIRSTRTRALLLLFDRGAVGREDPGGRQVYQHRRTTPQSFRPFINDTAAVQNLAVTPTTVTWTRGGSGPQFTRVTFEYSTDNVNYTPLGNGTGPAATGP